MISYSYKSIDCQIINALFGLSLIALVMHFSAHIHYVAGVLSILLLSLYFSFIVYFASCYGNFVDIGSFASILDSNYAESIEYVSQLEGRSLFIACITGLVFFASSMLVSKKTESHKLNINVIVPLLLIITVVKIVGSFELKQSNKQWVTASFSHHFLFDTALLMKDYVLHKKALSQIIVPSWKGVKQIEEGVDTYFVLLGESVDRKHMTLYGYTRNTTKVLNDFKGMTLVMDAISPAAQTRNSVPRMLMLNDKKRLDYNKNIVDLANMAGFETYWISNQGLIGRHDTPVTKLSSRANHSVYLNRSDFSASGYDYHLMKPIKDALEGNRNRKVIFVHFLGSHPEFCSRVWAPVFVNTAGIPKEINCYDDSIRNTMLLVSKLIDMTRKYGGKLIYTADHGVAEVDEPPYLTHGVGKHFSVKTLQVPLFIWDSHSQSNMIINKTYYMRNFVHTLADFLNIEAEGIKYHLSILSDDYNPSVEEEYVILSSGEVHYFK